MNVLGLYWGRIDDASKSKGFETAIEDHLAKTGGTRKVAGELTAQKNSAGCLINLKIKYRKIISG